MGRRRVWGEGRGQSSEGSGDNLERRLTRVEDEVNRTRHSSKSIAILHECVSVGRRGETVEVGEKKW